MILGFFYHIAVFDDNGKLYVPSYIGLFVDELAKHVNTLHYFAYTTTNRNSEQNYELGQKNIRLVNLGIKKSFPAIVMLGGSILSKHKDIAESCDAILVRAPSPLAPWFYAKFKKVTKIHYLMVGDYMEGIKHQNFGFVKQRLINLFTTINEFFQNRAIQNSGCLVNSVPLKMKYEKINDHVELVKTTTLTANDFYERMDTCANPDNIKLLFVGRIEKAKGMDELVEAFLQLRQQKYPVTLHLAGWNTPEAKSYFKLLESYPETANDWKYHGLLGGEDLFELYRSCDIFVLPSHHEGFPRVIWEAMANSLPVIATKVGSIPQNLKHLENAILIPPKDIDCLFMSIIELVERAEVRQNILANAYKLAEDSLMDKQVKKILNYLYE